MYNYLGWFRVTLSWVLSNMKNTQHGYGTDADLSERMLVSI